MASVFQTVKFLEVSLQHTLQEGRRRSGNSDWGLKTQKMTLFCNTLSVSMLSFCLYFALFVKVTNRAADWVF